MRKARIIDVVIERGGAGLYHATSPNLRGLLVSGETVEEVREAVPAVIEAIFDASGESVRAIEAVDDTNRSSPWVVLPRAELAVA